MNKFFKRLALVLVIVMALVMIPVSLAAADPLPADADPAVWDKISLTRAADGSSLVEGTDYTVTKGKYSHYAYSEPFTYNVYNVTTSDPIVISRGAAYKNSSLTYPLKSRITLGADVTSVTLKDVTALGELSVTEGSNVDFTLAGENYVDKILGTGLTTTITFCGEGSLTGEHIGGVDKDGADPATNVGCNIVINSGTFNITAGFKSAIGGGQYGNSGKITINGGNITAKSNYGAAIGGGQNGSATEIVITDGKINATGSFGAAIGGGQLGGAENISISGGTIEAKGSHVGAAIGGGQDGNVGTVKITDGDITVIARTIGIGGQDAENISISGGNIELKKLNSSSPEIPADAGMIGAANGSTDAVEISGGSFNVELPEDYLAEGTEIKKNEDGTYGVKAASVAKIGTVEYASLAEAIAAAKDGDVIVVSAGEYNLNGSLTYTGKAFTIKAADGAKVSFDMSAAVALNGAKITFEGVTFDYKTNGNYIGIQHADTLVYNNCTINGQVFLYATNETFNVCTFNQTSADAYNVWTYGAKNVEFNKCVFNCVGKSVLLYNEGANTGTDLTVTDTTFKASAPVEGKAAIEIDTSLMGGQSKITVDNATADKTTGFATGSNSGNSLWNDKKQTADTNQNTTVIVNGVTVFEPANFIDLDLFIKWLANNGYNVDGANYISNINAVVDGKLTVKWSPVSGCYDARTGHACTVNNAKATGNTPKRVNSGLTQFQLFEGSDVAVTIKNVKFVYEPAAFTVCENSDWKGSFTAEQAPAGQLYFMTTGDVTVESCDFEKVVFTTFNTTGTSIVNGCTFKYVYNSYAIKDIRGENVSVTGTTIENCGGGIMVSSTGAVSNVTITRNTFNNVDTAGTAPEGKVGTRAILQIASSGDYASTAFDFSGNTATSCGPVIRQLNATVAPVGSSLKYLTESPNSASGLYTSDSKGSKKNPYTLEELGAMTRAEYIAAQEALGGTMYVKIGNYSYDKDGVLGNGVRNDTPGQMPDHSKLNSYGENGYRVEKNDGANGKNIIFVGGSITSRVKGYASIDNIGTSLLLAVPAYTNVTFEGVTFNNVMSFDYQLYTSPWSQLGELKFSGCTFNGIIVGAIAAQTLTFDGCEFKNYTNEISANNSNPTWIRPAYGNWSKGDNDGQGSDFKSLTTINFTKNKVTSTRPVKFEYISQWDITSTVTATGNYFDITAQSGDDDTSIKNVGLYLGAHTDANEFHLVAADNTKSENTAALYTIPSGKTSLPVDSTVKNTAGESIELTDALKWKATDAEKDKIVLKTVIAVASIGERRFATLEEAVAAVAKNGDTITLLSDVELSSTIVIKDVMNVTLDLNGKKLSTTTKTGDATRHYYAIDNYGTFTLRDSSAEQSGEIRARGIENLGTGTMTIESGKIVAIDANGGAAIWNNANLTINGGTFVAEHVGASSDQYGPGCVYNNGTLTINGGTFTSANKRTYAIVSKAGTVTITPADGKNVTISGAHGGLGIDGGTAIINGGSYASSDYYGLYVSNDAGTADVTVNGGTFTGKKYSVLIGSDGSSSVTSTLKIKGGTFDMPIHAQENTIDGAIAISGGKFKFKVDDKYFANGHVCSGTPGADGYYTIADHPIESFGVTIGEGLSLRLYVRDEYRNGKLLVKYTTVGSNPEVEYEAKISSVIEKVDGVATIRYCARIFGITPQMADVIIKVQYVDENDVAIGSEKEVSILKYCHNYVKEDSPEAVKTFVSKMLEYCASAMDYRMVTNEDQIYLGYTWKQRADALRAEKVDICGEDKVKYEFDLDNLGTYTNIGTTFKTRGMVYDNIIRIYFAIPSEEFNPDYKYYMSGNEIHPTYNKAKDQWEFSFTIAPYEYCNSIRITIKDGEDEIGEYACSLAIILESFSRKSGDAETDALAKLSVAAYEYCRSLADYPTSKDFNQ